ncbi:MAG TPA: hypothetical protein ENJ95_10805 [Bacteroidetes bacterium]|nr:hypothetical protein [Bacteroidota bacterium]
MKKLSSLLLLAFACFSFFLGPPHKEVFTLKKFEKKLALIKPGLYAGKYEATNLEYNEFLKSIESESGTFEKARIHNENWKMGGQYNEPFAKTYHSHPAYAAYPVVNVSHEGAVAFCEWLTESYNAYPKRKFKKVKFRLPTEEEWAYAASGGHENAVFPWGGYYLMNSKGEVLANFRRVQQTRCKKKTADGLIELQESELSPNDAWALPQAHLIAPSLSYFPNGFGIYNASGNAAEMLAEPGRTKGGSWASYGYYLRIDAEDEFAGFEKPSPQIGFRYFMEVVEE